MAHKSDEMTGIRPAAEAVCPPQASWSQPLSAPERAALLASARQRAHFLRRQALDDLVGALLHAPDPAARALQRFAARLRRHRALRAG